MTSIKSARGKVVVLTFLYTSCWDLCPAQAKRHRPGDDRRRRQGRGRLRRERRSRRRHARPRREWIAKYDLEGKPVSYLTGTRRQLERVWRAYGIAPIGATPEEAAEYAEKAEYVESGGESRTTTPIDRLRTPQRSRSRTRRILRTVAAPATPQGANGSTPRTCC